MKWTRENIIAEIRRQEQSGAFRPQPSHASDGSLVFTTYIWRSKYGSHLFSGNPNEYNGKEDWVYYGAASYVVKPGAVKGRWIFG